MKLSIIVPAFNVEEFIGECISSLKQLKENDLVEIIIINDGSTDKTKQEIYRSISDLNNVKVINTENKGLSAARNLGIEESCGEYIMFLDSDDYMEDSFIFKLFETADFVDSSSQVMMFNYTQFSMSNKTNFSCPYGNDNIKEAIFEMNSWYCWRYIFKKELFENEKFDVGRRFEDQLTIPKIIYSAKSISLNNFNIVSYRINENGITKNLILKDLVDSLYGLEEYVKFYNNNKSSLIITLLGNLFISHISKCARLFYKDKYKSFISAYKSTKIISEIPFRNKHILIYKFLWPIVFLYLIIRVRNEVN